MSATTSTTVILEERRGGVGGDIELMPIGYSVSQSSKDVVAQRRVEVSATQMGGEVLGLTPVGTQETPPVVAISNLKAGIIIFNVSCINLINSMLSGILVVSLPTMVRDLHLSQDLMLWPASVSSLSCGCTLLLFGSMSDIIGGRKMYLTGTFSLILTTIACGLSTTGMELILFRTIHGLALSVCLPSCVLLITSNIPLGSYRNTAFACLGAAQPIGFSLGLVMGGIVVERLSWRYGYYIGVILTAIVFVGSYFSVPKDSTSQSQSLSTIVRRLKMEVDWTGCILLSTSLGMFTYVLAVLASGSRHFLEPASLVLLSIAVVLIPAFIYHCKRQEKRGGKVIVPPSLWSNRVFTCLCCAVFISWGTFFAFEYIVTLFFQSVQSLSPIQTSLRYLPLVVAGAATNLLTGWMVKRVRADVLALVSTGITALAPLLMAIVQPGWSYWSCAFFAMVFSPVSTDVLFTVASLVITAVFPPDRHGIAGGVFNTVGQLANSVSLGLTAAIAANVSAAAPDTTSPTTREMDGYRAVFWFCFAANLAALPVILLGLRKIGKVGVKLE